MNLKTKVKSARGTITIFKIKNNERQNILTRSNSIESTATKLLAMMMAGDTSATPKQIRVFITLFMLVATADFSDVDVTAAPDKVTYTALFSEDSFTGEINEAALGPTDMDTLGAFATAGAFSVTKAADEQLGITWEILFTPI